MSKTNGQGTNVTAGISALRNKGLKVTKGKKLVKKE